MTSLQISKALSEVSESYASIGRSLDPPVTRQTVRDVVVHGKTSKRIMLAVAETIGLPPSEVFPGKAHLFEGADIRKPSQNIPQSKVA